MKFTPSVLLSAPRRSAGIPKPAGTWILYTQSTYSFQTHQKTTELRVLSVETGDSHELAKDDEISDLNWLDDDEFVCLQAEKNGGTSLYVASVGGCLKSGGGGNGEKAFYVAGTIDAAAANLRVCRLDGERGSEFAVVVSAAACTDGSLFTPEKAARKTQSSGRLYDSLYVRHWDHYQEAERASLWFGKLSRKGGQGEKFELSSLTNALKSTGLESPMAPFGGTDHFDISPRGIIFVAKDPVLNPALNTSCHVYIKTITSWSSERNEALPAMTAPRKVTIPVPGFEGSCTSPVFAPDGGRAAFLMMKKNGYEADRNAVFAVHVGWAGETELRAEAVVETKVYESEWDRSELARCY